MDQEEVRRFVERTEGFERRDSTEQCSDTSGGREKERETERAARRVGELIELVVEAKAIKIVNM